MPPAGRVRARRHLDRGGVKAAPFDYLRARSPAEVVETLAADEGAKVIAGGQSLAPLMALRLARPTLLVDIEDLHLDTVAVENDGLRIGAGTTHRTLERHATVAQAAPLLREAASLIGYPAIRVRGTIGGSLAHADPAAELPAALVALGASVVAVGPAGERVIPAADLATGFLTTTLEPTELLVEIRLPAARRGSGAAFCEWAPRAGDFAVAGIAVVVERNPQGVCAAVHAAACGVGSTARDRSEAFAGVIGERHARDSLLRDVAGRFDHELLGLLAARALHRALERAA